MKGLSIDIARRVCSELYGREFSDRTWLRWRKLATISLDKDEFEEREWMKLVAIALIKRQNPFAKVTMTEIFLEQARLRNQPQTIERIRRISLQVLPNSCYGRELPDLIAQFTGRNVSIPTLYRWGRQGKKFGARRRYNESDISWWIRQARKMEVIA